MNSQLIFEVIRHASGGFSASCLNARINTRATDLQELHDNISSAVDSYFPHGQRPAADAIHLMLFEE